MKCLRCQAENRGEARFCRECGATFGAVCPSCGAKVEAGSRFCDGCGAHLTERLVTSQVALEGERKQVTVLFADLKGSMELLADRDPEVARTILDPVLEHMMEAVHRYEGTVNQVMGDGIMALFGAPLAHEDHAVRACHAALRMQAAMAEYAETVRRTEGVDVRIRVGVNSGEVVVRTVGSDVRMDYSAVGQTTHLAARLEQLAPPATIWISGSTRRLAGNFIRATPRGPVAIRGLAEPVEVFELAGFGPTRAPWQATRERRRTAFVGRDREIAVLRTAGAAAQRGVTQVIAVVGEPGVGKSRLVREFTRELGPAWLLLETGTVSDGRSHPYAPIASLLRAAFGITDTTAVDDARAAVATTLRALGPARIDESALLALLSIAPEDPAWHDLEPAQHRYRTLQAVADFVGAHAEARPVCLVIEDMHWIDADSEAVLHHVLARLDQPRLLLLVTYRPEYQHPWQARRHHLPLSLEPLSAVDATRMLGELLGERGDLDALKSTLVARTGGNPFFLEETVADLVERGALVGQRGGYQLVRDIALQDVPQSVEAVVAARIDRLPAHEKALLQSAAMIGADVPVVLLEAVSDRSDGVQAALLDLEAADLLYEDVTGPELRYRFRHALTVDVALASIVTARRRAIDARIIEASERHGLDQTVDQIERLAKHAVRSELWKSAVRYCRAAGAAAFARSAHRAAVEYLDGALGALARLPESAASVADAIDLRLELRSALIPLGDLKRIVETLREAEALAGRSNDRRRLGLVSSFLTVLFHLRGDLPRAIEKGERALDIARELDDRPIRIVANAYLALTYHTAGWYDRAVAIARENVTLIGDDVRHERFGMTVLPSVYSRTCLTWCLAERGAFDEGARVAGEAVAIAEASGHPYSRVYALLAAGVLHARRRNDAAAIEALEAALALCRQSEITALFATVAVPLASAYANAGRAADALALIDEAGAVGKAIGDPVIHWVRTGARAEALLAAGRPAEALPLAVAYRQQRRRLGAQGYEAWGVGLIGDVQAQLDARAAEAAYLEAIALATPLDMPPLLGHCWLGLGRALVALGRRDEARKALLSAADTFAHLGLEAQATQARQIG